jgi:hypothetical protein
MAFPPGKPSAEQIAEIENADKAAEELANDGHTARRCLKCGGELILEETSSSYQVTCSVEQRVILTARGI